MSDQSIVNKTLGAMGTFPGNPQKPPGLEARTKMAEWDESAKEGGRRGADEALGRCGLKR